MSDVAPTSFPGVLQTTTTALSSFRRAIDRRLQQRQDDATQSPSSNPIPWWQDRGVLLLGVFVVAAIWVTLRLLFCTTFYDSSDGRTVGADDDDSDDDDDDDLEKPDDDEVPTPPQTDKRTTTDRI